MNKQNTEKLFRTFPGLYQAVPLGRFRPLRQCFQETFAKWLKIKTLPLTMSLMGFGFDCSDGWFDLIWGLSEDLRLITKSKIKTVQIKEKFGGLRFYIGGVPDKLYRVIYTIIGEAERRSLKTCEHCGDKGELCKAEYWYATVCTKPECNDDGRYKPITPCNSEDEDE